MAAYLSGISGSLKRITKTAFYNDTPDSSSATFTDADSYHLASSKRLLRLPSSAEVQDGSATPKSRSEFTYDYTDYGSTNTTGGNLTETKAWDSFKGGTFQAYSNPLTGTNSITTSATYNAYGMPLTMTDANNVTTRITYGDVAGPNGVVIDLYPTQTEVAYGTPIVRTSTAAYDFYTGAVTTATDVDNNISTVTEYDALGRPKIVKNAYGTPLDSWVQTEYNDLSRYIVVRSDLEAKDDRKKVATQFFDQLGRVRLSKSLEDSATQSATNETDGIKVQTRYKFASGYTYQLASNPFRAAYATNETDATMGWTLSTAWSSGRRSEVQTFSGVALPTAFGGSNANSTGIVRTDIDAERTLVTDQAGKQRISKTNALGQLKEVWEITAQDSATESVTFPNTSISTGYKTLYSYDTLNNLTTVNQGVQTRSFEYSSLSRLLSANNPESGTINYVYDPNGNLTSKVDDRGVKTDYVYDALNRVTNRNYSLTGSTPPNYQATPDVSYTYDNLPNAKGKLIKVTNGTGVDRSTTEYTSFDILGRVTGHKQTTDGTAYTTGYVYNLSGAMIEETYPSGRVVKNTLETDGDLMQVQSRKANDTFRNYANAFQYNAAGAVTAMRLGNGKWETTQFNSRLQPIQIGLGASAASTNLLKLNYDYGTTQNNGNVLSQTITVPTVGSNPGFTAVQTYTYDSLNRLKDADEKPSGWTQANCDSDPTKCWKQTFVFDRYGNRTFDTSANRTTTIPTNCPAAVCNPSANAADNRLKTSDGYVFDNAGNTTKDAELRKFTYDGENKQVKVETVDAGGNPTGTIGEYFYDGDGRRVKKYVPATGETTIFVYDASNKLVAEYSTIIEPTATAKIGYLTNDHLGSPRINTDATGQVTARHDYHPFGEEIASSQRTPSLNYEDDTLRKQFAGYERDKETNLDYAKARMFGSGLGRFSSPDPLMASAKRVVPQSWNRYVYVLNNPLKYVDPSGMVWGSRQLKNGNTEYCYAKGKAVCDGFKAYKGDISQVILENATDSRGRSLGTIRLLPGGGFEQVIAFDIQGRGRSWLSQKDAEAINDITGGAICSLSAGFICPNAGNPTADKVAAAGDIIQVVFLIKSLVKLGLSLATIAAIVKKSPEEVSVLVEKVSSGAIKEVSKDFFEGTKYSNKVLGQMKAGDFHAFPESVKAFQGDGVITAIKGGDGITREMLKIRGSYKGADGVFEFIKESDGTINHRFFRPDP